MPASDESEILYATPGDGYVVFRVIGRGTFQNSVPLKQTARRMRDFDPEIRFIIDLGECVSMDSTFMGVLASLGLKGATDRASRLTVVNANEHSRRLLDTLGLSHFLDVRAPAPVAAGDDYQSAGGRELSRREHLIHMIEAHEQLVTFDNSNLVRFESVLKYLRESLDRTDLAGESGVAS